MKDDRSGALHLARQFNIVIADSPFETGDREQAILGGIGGTVRKFDCSNETAVIEATGNAHVIMCDVSPITRNVISNSRNLIGIVEYGVGYDNIDVNAATEKNIVVCNIPDFITSEVADHAVALILCMVRKLHRIGPSTRKGEWTWRKFRPIHSLDGKIAGIVGFGHIGRQVAERMRAFNMRLIVYDPYIPRDMIERLGARPAPLQELLKESDIVSIHVPLTKETRHLIGKNELALMKSSALLVNTSRGSLIDQEALVDSLRSGRIAGAGLDVLTNEPPDPSDLILDLDNAIVTPHMGWYSEESSSKLQESAALEARRILTGQTPKHPVNPEVLSKRRP